jgi:hypothetical protein
MAGSGTLLFLARDAYCRPIPGNQLVNSTPPARLLMNIHAKVLRCYEAPARTHGSWEIDSCSVAPDEDEIESCHPVAGAQSAFEVPI